MAAISRMQITRCNSAKKASEDVSYSLMLNPSQFKRSTKVVYNKTYPPGKQGTTKFKFIEPEILNFSFIIDGTGVAGKFTDSWVVNNINELRKVVYDYDQKLNEPSRVRIIWGTEKYYARLTSMETNYTMFTSDGKPLRAALSMTFETFVDEEHESAITDRSGDQQCIHTVKQEDNLPNICMEYYGDNTDYTAEVARYNNLPSLNNLPPNGKLVLPPVAELKGMKEKAEMLRKEEERKKKEDEKEAREAAMYALGAKGLLLQ
jgi:hypothetical protein